MKESFYRKETEGWVGAGGRGGERLESLSLSSHTDKISLYLQLHLQPV